MTPHEHGVEGRLDITLRSSPDEVLIRSSRPVHAARVFEGRTIEDTLRLLPLLFNVCGQSQAAAAVRAVESALGAPPAAAVERARDRLVALETLREHLWRVLLDWPRLCGDAQANPHIAPLMGLVQASRRTIDPDGHLCTRPGLRQITATASETNDNERQLRTSVAEQVFGGDPEAWLGNDTGGLQDWLQRVDTPATRLLRQVQQNDWNTIGHCALRALPGLDGSELLRRLDSDDADGFVAAPQWPGGPFETGSAARQADQALICALRDDYGDGLLLRLVARLVEIARLLSPDVGPGSDSGGLGQANGGGLSQLEAARGRLCHRVVLDGERIAHYRILAPTEWNFAPAGPAMRALRGVSRDDPLAMRAQAELLIHAIDPCVGYRLEITTG